MRFRFKKDYVLNVRMKEGTSEEMNERTLLYGFNSMDRQLYLVSAMPAALYKCGSWMKRKPLMRTKRNASVFVQMSDDWLCSKNRANVHNIVKIFTKK